MTEMVHDRISEKFLEDFPAGDHQYTCSRLSLRRECREDEHREIRRSSRGSQSRAVAHFESWHYCKFSYELGSNSLRAFHAPGHPAIASYLHIGGRR